MTNKITTSGSWSAILKEASPTKSRGGKRRGQRRRGDLWWRLNYTCGKVKGRSPTLVQVEGPNDSVDEHVKKADVENAIWTNIHRKRFYLAEEASVLQRKDA